MKQSIFQLGVLGVMFSLAMGCGGGSSETQESDESMTTQEEAIDAMEEAAETTGEYVEDATMQFESEVQAKLETIQKGIASLKAQAGEYGDEAAQQANQVLGPLGEKSQAIQQDLEGLKGESGEAMEQMRAGIENAVSELERAYQEARAQLQK
ncbi:MAG: hypothetical protein ACRD1X_05845 [Vicinamibacteria bacterium]